MIQKHIRNERGDLSYLSIFIILAVNMILAFVLLFATVRINGINIRNAAKMELNNVSARIFADTFHSQREANLNSYMDGLTISSAYKEALEAGFIMGLESRIPLSTDDYSLSNIKLNFTQHDGKIEYIFSCDARFQIKCSAMYSRRSQDKLP